MIEGIITALAVLIAATLAALVLAGLAGLAFIVLGLVRIVLTLGRL